MKKPLPSGASMSTSKLGEGLTGVENRLGEGQAFGESFRLHLPRVLGDTEAKPLGRELSTKHCDLPLQASHRLD